MPLDECAEGDEFDHHPLDCRRSRVAGRPLRGGLVKRHVRRESFVRSPPQRLGAIDRRPRGYGIDVPCVACLQY
jgi:hypothetical protein